jgi:uncharacterized protein (DUF1800 family)
MSLDPRVAAALALHRFGLGPRAGSITAIASDPRGALLAELDRPDAGLVKSPDLLSAGEAARLAFNFRTERQAQQIASRKAAEERAAAAGTMETPAPNPEEANAAGNTPAEPPPTPPQQNFQKEVQARLDTAASADIGFVERLVWFWSNHFCISADVVPSMVGAYEREVVRAHVLGRFADMLLAASSHPAMLAYLDNTRSVGPNSVAGLIRSTGLNENLAREILELHTLGVRTVYTQDDVTSFAKVLTGWTVIPPAGNPERGNEFVFNPRTHEPGPQVVLGKTYGQPGVEQGRAVLADLARHPATAAHVAYKLARHFVADDPPSSLTERLTQRFIDTGGHLKEIAKVLVAAPETWELPRRKLKRPSEWLIASWRALGSLPEPRRALESQGYLGERLWRPPAPKGFADEQAAWIDGVAQRLDIANRIAESMAATVEPDALMEHALGPLASAETRQAIARAESRQQALTLVLMAPEFQRR